MKVISHAQAQRWLAVGHTELAASEQEALNAHLAQCEACRIFASETLTLQQNLARVLQARWDGKQPTMTHSLSPQAVPPARRLNLLGGLVGVGALAALALALMFFFNRAPREQAAITPINAQTANQLRPALYKTDAITAVAFSQRAGSNVMALGYRDGRLELVEADTGQVRFFGYVSGEVAALAFAPSDQGETIATLTREGTIELWAVDITQNSYTLTGAPLLSSSAPFIQLALSPDGARLATLEANGSVKIFNTPLAPGETPPVQMQFDAPAEGLFMGDLAFSPDGQRLAVARATSTEVQVYNLITGAVENTFALPGNLQALFVSFTPDAQKVVVGGNPNAYIYDLASQQILTTFVGNATFLTAMRLSPDGGLLATAADNDQSLRLWNAEDGTLLREIQFPDPVRTIDFSADGQRLAVLWYGTDGAQLEIWSTDEAVTTEPTPVPLPSTTPPLLSETPIPTPAFISGAVRDVSVQWLPMPQEAPLPSSGFTFGAELTYTSEQDTIAHIVAFPLALGETPTPCENRAMPDGRIFWADQTNFPVGTHTFSRNFPYTADAFLNAAFLVVRVNVLDTAPASNLLACQQQVYAVAQVPLTEVPFATWTPCPIGVLCGTPTPLPTFTPCVIGCDTPPPFVTTVPSPTPCDAGCSEGTATPPPIFTPIVAGTPQAGCEVAWAFSPPLTNCPRHALSDEYQYQPFERGYLVRVLNYEAQPVIYGLFDDGTWVNFVDPWAEGMSEANITLVPPNANLYAPRRGFGLVWNQNVALRQKLGWALTSQAENGFTTYQSEWRPEAPGMNVHTLFVLNYNGVPHVVHLLADALPPSGPGQWIFWP